MLHSTRVWKWLGSGLLAMVVVLAVVRAWVVPAVLVHVLQREFTGRVEIRDWWLTSRSAGVVGLTLHETPEADSAVLATVERAATDLSIGALLRGRWTPRRIALERSEVRLRVDRAGRVLNLPTLPQGHGPLRLPEISASASRVVLTREGSAEAMVVSGAAMGLTPDSSGQRLTVSGEADDPTWGRWTAAGTVDLEASRGDVRLAAARLEADPKALATVPFVPAEVWTHVVPHGPVRVAVRLDWTKGRTPEFQSSTEVTLLGISARFPTLDLAADDTTGTLRVDGGVVRAEQVRGRTIGGRVNGGGTLDFDHSPAQIDLDLALSRINVEATPKLWQLDKAGITGRLTGTVALRAQLYPERVDLSGSTGTATIENASIQGIPVKSLRLAMHARGGVLEYDTETPGAAQSNQRAATRAALAAIAPKLAWGWGGLIALQAPANKNATAKSGQEPPANPAQEAPKFNIRLPKTISTQIELEEVQVSELIAKAQALTGFPFPIPITGKLSLKAKATIPLGQLSDLKQYVFHGDATLKEASFFKVDFALLTARLDLEAGVLELKQLRGALVDRPDGGPDNPPQSAPPEVPAEGPLPAGSFRGDLRAELVPLGSLKGRFEGRLLPVGELSAPLLPRPTPLAGLASLEVEAQADLAHAGDPNAWTVAGHAESLQLTYHDSALDRVEFRFQVKEGRLNLPSLTAEMDGHPLHASGELDLKPPQEYRATLKVDDWDLEKVLSLVPQLPEKPPVTGTLTAQAEAKGTLVPWAVTTEGRARLGRFEVASVSLGAVPFRWSTDRDSILITDVEAHPFGGRLTAEAHIPVAGGGAAEGTATIRGLDTAQLSASLPGGDLKLSGIAEGTVTFVVPAEATGAEANLRLTSKDLTFQGIPAEQVRVSIRAEPGVLKYQATADSLGGKVKFSGDLPLTSVRPPNRVKVANGELQFVGFSVEQLWKALGIPGGQALVVGQGAVNANVRQVMAGASQGLWAHGIVELRDLKSDQGEPLGRLRGIVAKSPTVWRVDPLNGELMGGSTQGTVWGTTPSQSAPEVGFNLRLERVTLKRFLSFVPAWASYVAGLGSLQVTGTYNDALRADVGLNVEQARVVGLPVSELRMPATFVFNPSSGTGSVQLRPSTARVSGGQVRGDASFRIGSDRTFQGQVQLADIDLQTLNRLATDSSRLASGRISGRISLSGPDPSQPERYRGRVNLDLDDAALFSIPIFREVEKFFGAARGGLFEDGDLVAAIGNRQLLIESFSLEGRLVQLHMTGTVGFDTQLNLEVLVNTSQLIPETGQVLLARIPGLSEVLGRNEQVMLRVSRFLSNRLVKLRVTGTLRNPSVAVDPSVVVVDAAVVFFSGVLKLPLGFVR